MADQTDVYIKNELTDVIQVMRNLPDGSIDLDITIAKGNKDKIFLPGPEISLVIKAPPSMDIRDCPIKVDGGLDLMVLSSRSNSNWTIKIVPNVLPPDVPTTVNVTVG